MQITESKLKRIIAEEVTKVLVNEGFMDNVKGWWNEKVLGHEPSNGQIGGQQAQQGAQQMPQGGSEYSMWNNQNSGVGTFDWQGVSAGQNSNGANSIREFINNCTSVAPLDKAVQSTGLVGRKNGNWYVTLSQALKSGQKVVMQLGGSKFTVDQSILDAIRAKYNSLYSGRAPMKQIQPSQAVTAAAQHTQAQPQGQLQEGWLGDKWNALKQRFSGNSGEQQPQQPQPVTTSYDDIIGIINNSNIPQLDKMVQSTGLIQRGTKLSNWYVILKQAIANGTSATIAIGNYRYSLDKMGFAIDAIRARYNALCGKRPSNAVTNAANAAPTNPNPNMNQAAPVQENRRRYKRR